jgi:hypothetical protein
MFDTQAEYVRALIQDAKHSLSYPIRDDLLDTAEEELATVDGEAADELAAEIERAREMTPFPLRSA